MCADAVIDSVTTVTGEMRYARPMHERPRYHANDHSRDVLDLEAHTVSIANARLATSTPTLDDTGFMLGTHESAIEDFRESRLVAQRHAPEIRELLLELTGADAVVVNPRGVLRYGERSTQCGKGDNSYPARFVHVDVSDTTAAIFAAQSNPHRDRRVRRFCHYNVWRVLTPAPQDVPLAVCDARSIAPEDLIKADAIFDSPGVPEWSFEGIVVKFNPQHRWSYFPDMSREDVLVFKTNDSDRRYAHCVPHVAFDDPSCPKDVEPRTSIEMRGIAYWYD